MLLHLIRDCSCSHAVDKIEIVNGHRIESCLINNTESVLSADKEGTGIRLPGETNTVSWKVIAWTDRSVCSSVVKYTATCINIFCLEKIDWSV